MPEFKTYYWGPYIMEGFINNELVEELLIKGMECKNIKELDARPYLAGMVDKEFYYEDWKWFVPKFHQYVTFYLDKLADYRSNAFLHLDKDQGKYWGENKKATVTWTLDKLWINFQEAFEYNPPHNHTGDISFVIYIKVPKEIKEENEAMLGVHNNPGPGMINFEYGEDLPFSISKVVKLPEEGSFFMFPSWLKHYVFGHTSDVERISVSGNISLQVKVKDETER